MKISTTRDFGDLSVFNLVPLKKFNFVFGTASVLSLLYLFCCATALAAPAKKPTAPSSFDTSDLTEIKETNSYSPGNGGSTQNSTSWETFVHPLWNLGKFAIGAQLTEPLLGKESGSQKTNQFSQNSFGIRAGLADGMVADVHVLLGIDKEAKKQNAGAKIEILQTIWGFMSSKPTIGGLWAFPFFGLGVSFGQNAGEGNKPRTDFQAFALGNFGVEFMLSPFFSLGIKTGLQTQIVPSKWFKVLSSSSGIQAHIYF